MTIIIILTRYVFLYCLRFVLEPAYFIYYQAYTLSFALQQSCIPFLFRQLVGRMNSLYTALSMSVNQLSVSYVRIQIS